MLDGLSTHQITYLIILVLAFALLLTERLRNDVVAILIVVSLYGTGILSAEEALAGFSSEPAIVVAGIFVLSAGLHLTGLSESAGAWIGRLAGSSYPRAIAVMMPSVALLSAFTHHLTTTAIMLPVSLRLAQDRGLPPSRLLMPMSFAASLGTTITIIGAPAFLIASGVLQQVGRPGLSVFSIAPIGLALSVVGTVYTLLLGRFLLPDRGGGEGARDSLRLDGYYTELTILPNSPFRDRTLAEVDEDSRYQFDVAGLVRNGHQVFGQYDRQRLAVGDVLLIRTTPDEMVAIRQESGIELNPVAQYEGDETQTEDADKMTERLAQAVIAPRSNLIGRTLSQVGFRRRYGALVVGLWRREGIPPAQMAHVTLRAGDVLVLQGEHDALARVAANHDFLMVMPFAGESRARRKAPIAGALMAGTVIAAASGWLSIEMASVTGAIGMVLTGCLTPGQAYRAIDQRIFVFIAGAIPLGTAMKSTGMSDLLAGWFGGAVGGLNQVVILAVLFVVAAVLTQFMSDAATTALFGPLAATLAIALGLPPEPFVVTVAMAAVASFLTPIGHHGNLLIYGPGGYHFTDFVRVGTPLTILVGIVVVLIAPILWPA